MVSRIFASWKQLEGALAPGRGVQTGGLKPRAWVSVDRTRIGRSDGFEPQ